MPIHRASMLIAASLLLVSCAQTQASRCASGEQSAISDTLYFGTNTPKGMVTADEWAMFLEQVVTPRFPAGLTVVQATGQWRGADGATVREATYVLQLLRPASDPNEKAVGELVTAYKVRFQQESVLRVKGTACMSL